MSKYRHEYAKQAQIACRLGAIDLDLAELFDVSRATIFTWRNTHPEFDEACQGGKECANTKVKQALFKRATGCVTFKEVLSRDGVPVELQTEHPPETAACMSWLYNRDRDNWKKDPALIDADKDKDSNVYNITIVKPDDSSNNSN